MRLINRLSGEVVGLNRNKSAVYIISVKDYSVYFSKAFCLTFGLKAKQFVQFINDEKDWQFFVNDDPDGFELSKAARESGALEIHNSGLCHLMKKTIGINEATMFKVVGTQREQKGAKIFMIITDKPLK